MLFSLSKRARGLVKGITVLGITRRPVLRGLVAANAVNAVLISTVCVSLQLTTDNQHCH